jgi:hypothetical protein
VSVRLGLKYNSQVIVINSRPIAENIVLARAHSDGGETVRFHQKLTVTVSLRVGNLAFVPKPRTRDAKIIETRQKALILYPTHICHNIHYAKYDMQLRGTELIPAQAVDMDVCGLV